MPMNRRNTRTFHRRLFGGVAQKVRLLKRGDDLEQGTVTAYILFQCRQTRMTRQGGPIQGHTTSNTSCTWHVPVVELKRVGVHYLNALDRIVDSRGRYWQPESTTSIDEKMFENHVDLDCLAVDPTPEEIAMGRG